jgi:hypothetical protein
MPPLNEGLCSRYIALGLDIPATLLVRVDEVIE